MPPRPPPRPPMPAPSGGQNIDSMIVDVIVALVIFLLIAGLFGSFFISATGGYLNVITWFYTRNWKIWYIVGTIFVGLLDAGLLFAAAVIVKRYNKLRHEIPQAEIAGRLISPEQEFQTNWQEITSLTQSGNGSDWNMAILRADAQLDDLLSHLGYEGETIAERLKIVDPTKLKSIDRIWSAHRLRNTIAHEPLQQYTREMIMHALNSYELAFQELGFLQAAEIPADITDENETRKSSN